MTNLLSNIKQFVLLVLLGSFSLFSAASAENTAIEVTFSDYLDKRMDRISAVDKKREKVFRKYRRDGARSAQRPRDVLNKSRFFQTEWANERLIPDLDQYDVPSLITEMMKRGIEEANPDGFDGRVVLEVDKLFIARFPLASISSFSTQMGGAVKLFDNQGNLITTHKIWASLVPKFTATRNYKGPDYAYLSTAGATRVGPVAGEFTAKALEKIFPDYDAPDLIFLQPAQFGG